MRALLLPFAVIFRLITSLRALLYDRGFLAQFTVSPHVKVIVIGNITAGGTGKTPLTALIARQLRAQGLRVGIVSRGYKGTYEGIAKVPPDSAEAKRYGDEPSWLAQELGADTPVYVGRERVAAARDLVAKENVQVVIADDAFQHRRLRADFNIVIIDATEPLWHYRPLPWGRAREPLPALKRADVVVLNKINFVDQRALAEVAAAIRPHLAPGAKIIPLAYGLTGYGALHAEGEWPLSTLAELKVFLVSGLGRPDSFEKLVREQAGAVTGHLTFKDHHAYTARDLVLIEERARATGSDAVVVTQKDAVKLRQVSGHVSRHKDLLTLPVFVTCLELEGSGRDELNQEIRQKIL